MQQPSRIQSNVATQTIQVLPLDQTSAVNRFAVIGDAGTGKDGQMDVAKAMENVFTQRPFASVLVLGDNVYPDGKPELFDSAIRQPYQALSDAGVRFYPVLGNHDITPQAGYGIPQLNYWGVPRCYSKRLGDTEIFALDSTVFSPDYRGGYYKGEAPRTWALNEAQRELTWLDQALSKSDARFKVVYAHYPMYSHLENREPENFNNQWRGILEPVLVKHNVDAYLAGHNHDYEKTPPIHGIRHFVSGAGGRLEKPSQSLVQDPLSFPIEKKLTLRHFMFFETRPNGLFYQAIGTNGRVLDEGLISQKPSFSITG